MDPHDLYGLALDRFVPERTALARALRKDGRREEAAEVAALRKPSVAAWAVNQLVRTQRAAVTELYDAGDAARRAQSQLLAGRAGAKALRESLARERTAVNELLEKARGLLSSEGQELTPTMLERVSETLHAAALEEDARTQVRDGSIHKELRRVGLGSGDDAAKAPEARSGGGRPPKAPPGGERADGARAKRAQSARKAEADARRVAERAARELASARERRDGLAGSLREAEDALAAAKARVEEAERDHQRARRAIEQL